MKTNRERLLFDVLHDENYAAFRAALLENSLGELRRVVRNRRRNQYLAIAAGVLLTAGLFLLIAPQRQLPKQNNLVGQIVRSKPISKKQIVRTTGRTATLVKTPTGQVLADAGVELVRSDPQLPGAEIINDQQLLAALAGDRIGLITVSPGKKQLLLFGPGTEVTYFDASPKK